MDTQAASADEVLAIVLLVAIWGTLFVGAVGWVVFRVARHIAERVPYSPVTSTSAPVRPSDPVVAERNNDPVADGVAGFATPYNDRNDPLRVATSATEAATMTALAKLIVESNRRPFQNGKVPETRGLSVLFGVTATSDPTSEYQRLRLALKGELAHLSPASAPQFPPLTPGQEAAREEIGLLF